jgi:hypothetical protein
MGSQRAKCAKVPAVQGEDCVGPILGRNDNGDRVGQIQSEIWVSVLDRLCCVEHIRIGVRDLKPSRSNLRE